MSRENRQIKNVPTDAGTIKRAAGIDQFRLIAAVMVIAIHTFPFASVSPFLDEVVTLTLFRIAVPFFFMVTGYYVLGPYAEKPVYGKDWKIKKTITQLTKIYLAASLLYLPLSFYNGTVSLSTTVFDMIKLLLFDGSFYHLWYFPAVILGLLMCRLLLNYLSFTYVLIIVFGLYLLGLGGDSYYFLTENVTGLKSFYTMIFQLFDYTRNGLFFSPLFLIMGAGIYLKKDRKQLFSAIKVLIGFMLLLVEGLLLHRGAVLKHDSMYLVLPLTMYFLFRYLADWKPKWKMNKASSYSLWLYLLHPVSIAILYFAGRALPIFQNSGLQFLAVVILTGGMCSLIVPFLSQATRSKRTKIYRAGKEIKMSALGRNLQAVQQWLSTDTKIMAVLKADAYGHGAVKCGQYLEKQGVNFFAVATLEEAIVLRKNGLQGNILLLGYTDPGLMRQVAEYDLIQSVFDHDYAVLLNKQKRDIRCHLEINTGMNRLGFAPDSQKLLPVYNMDYLHCEGIFSHLGSSDTLDEKARKRTEAQIRRFDQLLEQLAKQGIDYGVTHLQSSYGVVNYPELSYDYARVGIFLYGVLSEENQEMRNKIRLEPVLSLQAVVASVKKVSAGEYLGYGTETVAEKDMVVGVVAIGYADGLARELSNTGYSLNYCDYQLPQVGRICMDMLLVDVTGVPGIKTGTQVMVLENSEIAAAQTQTITNEVLSRMGGRLEAVSE